ncbi:CaiB/BaiF CoA transferase family protein [Cumulibacter soli]|uniref:CaiB/BaiF CoA transferase family protein n=1 Tax=Cumulibacter soli TaxID=2546344 RepID=UPI0010689D15|nr:CoA transferase [Cumulibacter soli]
MSEDPPSPGALTGIRVLELTHAIAGPQCGQILADRGADVIKIEPPEGDSSRMARPVLRGDSVYFSCHNRGKRSITLDLKSAGGKQVMDTLVAQSDIILTNYSAAVPTKLGWDYEQLKEEFPWLIFVHITGFGRTSPDADRRAYDGIIQSMSGIPASTGEPGQAPTLSSAFVADHIASYSAALGAMFALRERERTGQGSLVDISMLDSYAAGSAHFLDAALSGAEPQPSGNRVATAFANTFHTTDGVVYLAPIGDAKWRLFSELIGRDDWAEEIPYREMVDSRRDEAEEFVERWCADRSTGQVIGIMDDAGIPCGPVLTARQYADRAVDAGATLTVTAPGGGTVVTPGPIGGTVGLARTPRSRAVPQLGEHSDEILLGLAKLPRGGPRRVPTKFR